VWSSDVVRGGENIEVRAIICYNALSEITLDRRRRSNMDTTRKATREGNEITLQYQSPQEVLLVEGLNEDQLTELLKFISGLEQTPVGAADLERRIKLFGECKRNEGETSGEFYGRLRHWLDRDMPQTKSPFHAPRQTGD
jgi:hypothetical protein